MNLSQEAIQRILGIESDMYFDPKEMAKNLMVTFFPESGKNTPAIKFFKAR